MHPIAKRLDPYSSRTRVQKPVARSPPLPPPGTSTKSLMQPLHLSSLSERFSGVNGHTSSGGPGWSAGAHKNRQSSGSRGPGRRAERIVPTEKTIFFSVVTSLPLPHCRLPPRAQTHKGSQPTPFCCTRRGDTVGWASPLCQVAPVRVVGAKPVMRTGNEPDRPRRHGSSPSGVELLTGTSIVAVVGACMSARPEPLPVFA